MSQILLKNITIIMKYYGMTLKSIVAPVFRISPQIFHPWVDAGGMIVGHKKLGAGWNQHVSLANVTNEIIKELKSGSGNTNNNNMSLAPQQAYPGLGMSASLPRMGNSYYYNKPQPQVPPPPRPYRGFQSLSLNRPNTISSINNLNPPPPVNPINNNNVYNPTARGDVDINDLDNM
ncbi:hypothetical protein PIROE2DRAFT_11795, partial [Piromyces sp. E2]